jgi:hypothetical protein
MMGMEPWCENCFEIDDERKKLLATVEAVRAWFDARLLYGKDVGFEKLSDIIFPKVIENPED